MREPRTPRRLKSDTRARRKSGRGRKEKLLSTALELFSRRDFASVTIKDIGKATGINSALIYYYFRDKTDLLRASLDHAVNQTLENYALLKEHHTNPADLLVDWFENNLELAKPIRQVVKIMLDYSTSDVNRPVIDAIIERFYAEEERILSSVIEAGIEAGVFKPVDAKHAAQIASTYLDGIMVRSIIQKNFSIRGAIDDLRRLLWERLGYRQTASRPTRRATRR